MASPWVRRVLGVACAAAVAGPAAAASPDCRPRAVAALVERFVPADCARCWAGTARDAALPPGALAIDWIVPAGDAAPLAAAALGEAVERAGAAAAAGAGAVRHTALAARGAPRLRIADGPAWNGYIGLRLVVTRAGPWRPGARAFAALVERVPAGTEDSAIERRLVRAVAGPLPLDELLAERSVEHVRAVSVPPGSRVDRLSAVAWVESAGGRVVAAAAAPPPACR